MPTDHIKQWQHNRAFISTIDPQFPDWAVTATFYTALHAIDALLKHDKAEGITTHAARNDTLMRTSRYEFIWRNYQPLYGLARTIRYLAKPTRWVPWKQIETEVFRRYLYPLERSAFKLMGIADVPAPITMKVPPEVRKSPPPDPNPFPA